MAFFVVIFIIIPVLIWTGIIILFKNQSKNPKILFAQCAVATLLCCNFFASMIGNISTIGNNDAYHLLAGMWLSPYPLYFYLRYIGHINILFIGPLLVFTFAAFLILCMCFFKKNAHYILASVVSCIAAIFLFFIIGNITAHILANKSAKELNLECYDIRGFDKSVFEYDDFKSPHGMGANGDQIYLWSYRRLEFAKLPKGTRYRATNCATGETLKLE